MVEYVRTHSSLLADNANYSLPLCAVPQLSYYKNKVPKRAKVSSASRKMGRYNNVLVLSFLVLQFTATLAQVDRTLEDGAIGTDVVIATVDRIRESGIFPNDYKFLRRMARVESSDGETAETTGGIWQVTRSSRVWSKLRQFFSQRVINNDAIAQDLQINVQSAFNITWTDAFPTVQDLNKPLYSALGVMLYIQVQEKTIPDDVPGQANLWHELFSTETSTLTNLDFRIAAAAIEEEGNQTVRNE